MRTVPPGDFWIARTQYAQRTAAAAKGNKTAAGRLLGLNRDQVRYRLDKSALADQDKSAD